MNKVLKGLVAVAATAAMAIAGVAGASTAMAEENTTAATNPTITFPTDTKYQDHTYEVYQIFTGDLSSDGVLSNVKYGKNSNQTEGDEVPATELKKLTDVNVAGKTDQDKLDVIKTFANLNSDPIAKLTKGNAAYTAAPGYYLIKDKDGSVSGNDANTLYITQVVGDVTISPKSDVPSFQKKVKDVNDSTGEGSIWQDSADYDVKDKVPFQLTATLPTSEANFAAYKTYKLVFHDQQSAGLTFDKDSVVVRYGDKTLDAGSYTLDQNPTDDHTFDITITNAKSVNDTNGSPIAVEAGGQFTVEYKSELNENAVIGAAGNPNEASLEFSNNPNVGGEGNTGKTPTDKVIVFTYQLDINKTFDQGAPAKDDMPKFKLYKKDYSTNQYNQVGTEITLTKGGTEEAPTYTGSFQRIDDGDYKLVESHTPAGYNTAADKQFTVTADHEVLSDDPKLISLKIDQTKGNEMNGTVQADVVNKKGSNLPSTGGMGTTILYAAGAAIVLVAAFGIAFAVRRRNAR